MALRRRFLAAARDWRLRADELVWLAEICHWRHLIESGRKIHDTTAAKGQFVGPNKVGKLAGWSGRPTTRLETTAGQSVGGRPTASQSVSQSLQLTRSGSARGVLARRMRTAG